MSKIVDTKICLLSAECATCHEPLEVVVDKSSMVKEILPCKHCDKEAYNKYGKRYGRQA